MSREESEKHLAKTVIEAAAKELRRRGRGMDVLAKFRMALCASRDDIVMAATKGDVLPDEEEELLSVSVCLIWHLERAIDEIIGVEPVGPTT